MGFRVVSGNGVQLCRVSLQISSVCPRSRSGAKTRLNSHFCPPTMGFHAPAHQFTGAKKQTLYRPDASPLQPGDFFESEAIKVPERKEPSLESGKCSRQAVNLSRNFLSRQIRVGTRSRIRPCRVAVPCVRGFAIDLEPVSAPLQAPAVNGVIGRQPVQPSGQSRLLRVPIRKKPIKLNEYLLSGVPGFLRIPDDSTGGRQYRPMISMIKQGERVLFPAHPPSHQVLISKRTCWNTFIHTALPRPRLSRRGGVCREYKRRDELFGK